MTVYIASNGIEHVMLHLNGGFVEFPKRWFDEAKKELELKAFLKLEDFTAVDKLAMLMLTETY